jgi:hypothetical protein
MIQAGQVKSYKVSMKIVKKAEHPKKHGRHFTSRRARRIIAYPGGGVTEPKIFQERARAVFVTSYEFVMILMLKYICKNFKAFHSFNER